MSSNQHDTRADGDHGEGTALKREPTRLSKLSFASYIYSLKGILASYLWLRDCGEYFNPPNERPDIIKTYECRPSLPVRIFFPSSFDETSPTILPTLFTIHGGGFCIGTSRDDDEWNRAFANTHHVLVLALNYSKAPAGPFPAAPHDIQALLLAALVDESLPLDRARTAVLGFSAGGNLALSAVQLPTLRAHPHRPAAAISVYGCLDLSIPPEEKLRNRQWKPALPPPRGNGKDSLMALAPAFDWGYIPYGQDLRDPLLSPGFAAREALPPFVCLVGAELDMLAHESWRAACGFSGRKVPDRGSQSVAERVCGREEAGEKGVLVGLGGEDERFAFEEKGVKWLLVPDVLHGFDNAQMRKLVRGEEAIEDAVLKTEAYTAELARWLKEVVWRV